MVLISLWLPIIFAPTVSSLTHIVCVGCFERDFIAQFTPPSITVEVGDFVEFQWHNSESQAHSVTRGSYNGFPCQPAIDGMNEQEGRNKAVSSGFIDRFGPENNTWTIQINDTDPFWYYDCSDCGVRMAGVINPPTNPLDGNITEWQAAAIFSIRYIPELERCTAGEQGGTFAHLSIQEMWNPENENATKTVEDSEGAVEKEKARWASLSSEVTTSVPSATSTSLSTPSTVLSPTSTTSSSETPIKTSENASSKAASSTASSIASSSTSPTTSNAAERLADRKGMMALIVAMGGIVRHAWI